MISFHVLFLFELEFELDIVMQTWFDLYDPNERNGMKTLDPNINDLFGNKEQSVDVIPV